MLILYVLIKKIHLLSYPLSAKIQMLKKLLNNDLSKILAYIQSRFHFDKFSTIGLNGENQKIIRIVTNVKF